MASRRTVQEDTDATILLLRAHRSLKLKRTPPRAAYGDLLTGGLSSSNGAHPPMGLQQQQKGECGNAALPKSFRYCPLATPGSPPPGAIAGSCWACRVIPTGKIGLPIPSNISALAVYQAAMAEMMNT
jgi:hypothetical protein